MGKTGHKHTEEAKEKMSQAHKGKRLSEEHKQKISEALKRRAAPSLETREKLSKANQGREFSKETRRKMSEAAKGKKLSPEHRRKISEALSKRVVSEETREKLRQRALERGQGKVAPSAETRRKMSESHKGKKRVVTEKWKRAAKARGDEMRGEKLPKEQRLKISESLKGRGFSEEHRGKLSRASKARMQGENSPWYIDGRSKLNIPYPEEFNQYLKRKVRRRDSQTCQVCGETAKGKRGQVHHIDGNKQNCKIENLALVCISCHNQIHAKNKTSDTKVLEFRSKLTFTVPK